MALPKLNLNDNILRDLKEFKVEDFVKSKEVAAYINKIPGIKDIVGMINSVIGEIKKFAQMVLSIIAAILSLFNIDQLLSELGLSDLLNWILNLIAEWLGLGSLASREDLRNSFLEGCLEFSDALHDQFGVKNDNLFLISFVGVLMALLCLGIENAFSSLLKLTYGDKANDEPIPAPIYMDDKGVIVSHPTNRIFNQQDIDNANRINEENRKHREKMDNIFVKIISPVMSKTNTYSLNFIEDVRNTNLHKRVRYYDRNIESKTVSYIDKIELKGKDKDRDYDTLYGYLKESSGRENNEVIYIASNSNNISNLAKSRVLNKTPDLSMNDNIDNSIDDEKSIYILNQSKLLNNTLI